MTSCSLRKKKDRHGKICGRQWKATHKFIQLRRLVGVNSRIAEGRHRVSPYSFLHCQIDPRNSYKVCGFSNCPHSTMSNSALDISRNLKDAAEIEFYYSESDTRPIALAGSKVSGPTATEPTPRSMSVFISSCLHLLHFW